MYKQLTLTKTRFEIKDLVCHFLYFHTHTKKPEKLFPLAQKNKCYNRKDRDTNLKILLKMIRAVKSQESKKNKQLATQCIKVHLELSACLSLMLTAGACQQVTSTDGHPYVNPKRNITNKLSTYIQSET